MRRKQASSILGQFCAAQDGFVAAIGRRSALARAWGMSAVAEGVKLGKIVIAAATNVATATAASALIIVRVPCCSRRGGLQG